MRALYYDKKATYIKDYPMPVHGPSESLMRISIAAVCSTDKEILKGYKPDFTGVMGHEFADVVEQSGNPDLIGKRVVGELNAGCG